MASKAELEALRKRIERNSTAYAPSTKRDTEFHIEALALALDAIDEGEEARLTCEAKYLQTTRVLSFLVFHKAGRLYRAGEEAVKVATLQNDVKVIALKHRAHDGKVVYTNTEHVAARIRGAVGDNAKRELVNAYLAKPKDGVKRQLVAGIKVPFTYMVKVSDDLLKNHAERAKEIAAMNDPQAQQEAFAALMHERYAPFVYDDDGNMVRDENNVIVRGELTFQALKNFLDSGKASATTLTNPQKVEKLVKTNTDMGDLVAMVAPIVDRIATLEHDNAILGGDQPSPLTDLAAEVIGRLVDADQLQKLAELVIGRIDALTPKDEPAPETAEVIPMTGTNG